MLSRFALGTGRLVFPVGLRQIRVAPAVAFNNHQIRGLTLGSNAEPLPWTDEGYKEFNYPDDECYLPPLAPEVQDQVVKTIEECRETEPLEDRMCVWFGPSMPTINDEKNPQRDTVNFPRPKSVNYPEATRLVVIPDYWFRAFYDKTGVTGPYLLTWGLFTFLTSKELIVFEHEMVSGLSVCLVLYAIFKKFGDVGNRYLEGHHEWQVYKWHQWQEGCINALEQYIAGEKTAQESLKGQKILFEAKKENVHLQREAEYRRRLMTAFNEVKRKLDYQVAAQNASKQFAQKHMVDWIIRNVTKGITPQQEKETLTKCIADLKSLSLARAGVI